MRTISRRLTDAQLLAAARLSGVAHRARKNEDGQASAEYAGIIFVAVALVGVLIGAADTWGNDIKTLITDKIQELGANT